jgi:hypothetical protein
VSAAIVIESSRRVLGVRLARRLLARQVAEALRTSIMVETARGLGNHLQAPRRCRGISAWSRFPLLHPMRRAFSSSSSGEPGMLVSRALIRLSASSNSSIVSVSIGLRFFGVSRSVSVSFVAKLAQAGNHGRDIGKRRSQGP